MTARSRERVNRACGHCGSAVTRLKSESDLRAQVFCNQSCYWASDYRAQLAAEANRRRFPHGKARIKCVHCGAHLERHPSQVSTENFCSRTCRSAKRLQSPTRQITTAGYAKVFIGKDGRGADRSGHILEHRKVMQDRLGRALLDVENVHHKNGIRADNRFENLELWSRSQPSGQRVEDKLRWAREFLDFYEGQPPGA